MSQKMGFILLMVKLDSSGNFGNGGTFNNFNELALETMKKYIQKLEEEIQSLKQEISSLV